MPVRPPRLQPGDTIGIVAPASPPTDPKALDRGIAVLEELGFQVKLAANLHKRRGFLAGTDRERAGDLMTMFGDPKVNAILCLRGGYGTARLLPLLDYRAIHARPKIFLGFSDITCLHCALLTRADLVSFHGPMLHSNFGSLDLPAFTVHSFLRTLMPSHSVSTRAGWGGSLADGYRRKTVQTLRRGIAVGRLIGGNLSVLCTTLGTPWQPRFRGSILFFEDLNEPPYRFDRMLTHLLNCGLLQQVAGIAIGLNTNCEDPRAKTTREFRQTLADVLQERLLPLRIPVVTGLPFGHVPYNATVPLGVKAELNANRGELTLLESAVS